MSESIKTSIEELRQSKSDLIDTLCQLDSDDFQYVSDRDNARKKMEDEIDAIDVIIVKKEKAARAAEAAAIAAEEKAWNLAWEVRTSGGDLEKITTKLNAASEIAIEEMEKASLKIDSMLSLNSSGLAKGVAQVAKEHKEVLIRHTENTIKMWEARAKAAALRAVAI